jgi:hypothetical protein
MTSSAQTPASRMAAKSDQVFVGLFVSVHPLEISK